MEMTSLKVFPAEYLGALAGGATRLRLEVRDEKFYEYLRGTRVAYLGASLGPEPRWVSFIIALFLFKTPLVQ
jgi:hypothetical protein